MRAYAKQYRPDKHHRRNNNIACTNSYKIAQKEGEYDMCGNTDNRKGKGDYVHVHGTNDMVFKINRLFGPF